MKTRDDMEVKKQIFCIICIEMLIIILVLMYFTSQKTFYIIFLRVMDEIRKIGKMLKKLEMKTRDDMDPKKLCFFLHYMPAFKCFL